jgi:hypothetical protein
MMFLRLQGVDSAKRCHSLQAILAMETFCNPDVARVQV